MRQPRSDGIAAAANRRQAADQQVPVPELLSLPTKAHKIVWKQFSSMRLLSDWTPGALVQLHEAVRIEVEIRATEKRLKKEGTVIEDARGQPQEHPLMKVLTKYRAQKLAVLRSLGLNVDSHSGAAANKRAATLADKDAAEKVKTKPNLLAVPT